MDHLTDGVAICSHAKVIHNLQKSTFDRLTLASQLEILMESGDLYHGTDLSREEKRRLAWMMSCLAPLPPL